jgi:RHH-type proline utilization regulon transcriptional repressor/proline dehydrogenase/delta 1-pyrroline-5-carboxylate dehydrogenase
VPRDVLQLVPGQGETVGAALVRDPRVAIVMFTGSAEVGLELVRAASDTSARARSVKRVVCEMGGKNAIIVDSTADLDEAVIAVRDSAFGFQGQKCSACSRAIVLADVHDTFLERLIEATRSLVIGDPVEPDTDFGPLIDEAAAEKVRVYIEIGMSEGKLELAVEPPLHLELRLGRPVVGPHIFSSILPEHRLAQEEIFGPVLAVMCAPDLDTAIAWANHPSTGLTGGVMSRTPSTLLRAQRELRVGNLYLNRGITGARVGRQPFGGVGLSGVGAQAGGPAYLRQLVDPLTVCENTIRRGFSPEPAGNGSESAARR